MESNIEIWKIHEHRDFMAETAELINTYWSRSKTARLLTLEKSCENLPCCLIMVENGGEKPEVIGHSRVVRGQGVDNACYIETVMVKKELRGKGLGRKLMEASEQFAKSKGYRQMYLNTVDKEEFYSHLGYRRSQPILTLGANADLLPQHMIDNLAKSLKCKPSLAAGTTNITNTSTTCCTGVPSEGPAPPPPPPVPNLKKSCGSVCQTNTHVMDLCCDPNKVVWMCKDLVKE